MNKSQKGFTVVEILLLILVLAVVGFGGYYVWNQNKKDNSVSTPSISSNSDTKKVETTATPEKDGTADWFTYTPVSNVYSIRIPDGWQLHYSSKDNGGSGDPYSWSSKELTFKAGTKAMMIEDIGGRDGAYFPFMLSSDAKNINLQGAQQSQYKTASGLDVTKYLYVQGADQEGMAPPVGTKIYEWRITQGTKTIIVEHGFIPGDADNSALVEKMINTLNIN